MLEFLRKLFAKKHSSTVSSSGPDPVAVYALTSDPPSLKDKKSVPADHSGGPIANNTDNDADDTDGDVDFDA